MQKKESSNLETSFIKSIGTSEIKAIASDLGEVTLDSIIEEL